MSDTRNVMRCLIHDCYAGKLDAGSTLQKLYGVLDDDEQWGGDEECEDEECEDEECEDEECEESGGFFDTILDLLSGE